MDPAFTHRFCQEVVEVVFLYRYTRQADTCTRNSSLMDPCPVKGLWLTTGHSTVHQVSFVNYVASKLDCSTSLTQILF